MSQYSRHPHFCGLDFGTSNSTIGIYINDKITMVPLENNRPLIRSAIFFDYEKHHCIFGQTAIDEYLTGVTGRLMVSLKSILGSSLMQEKTLIDSKMVSYTTILGYLIKHLKQKSEALQGHEITHVVMGRPVRFHDHDDKRDQLAQNTLMEVAKQQGFKTVLFQYEPIAAALAYEQSVIREELALIVDLGGGTSDFSIIRLRPPRNLNNAQNSKNISEPPLSSHSDARVNDVLSNRGIHIGGTDFDAQLSLNTVMPTLGLGGIMQGISGNIQIPSGYYHDLTTWHTINSLYNHKVRHHLKEIWNFAIDKKPIERLMHIVAQQQGHRIQNEVEKGKCFLSEQGNVDLALSFIEKDFSLGVTRDQFENIIHPQIDELKDTVLGTVKDAGVPSDKIDSIFFTGGSTQIPIIRQTIQTIFPNAKVVKGDVFNSVGTGLILDAKRRFLENA